MPIEKINLSKEIFLDFSIAFLRLLIDSSPQPSSSLIILYFKLKILDGSLINFNSQNCSITFFPKPSILNASLETICFSFSFAIYSQSYPFIHLLTASYFFVFLLISFFVSAPHRHFVGKLNFFKLIFLFVISTETTCGITSPAL